MKYSILCNAKAISFNYYPAFYNDYRWCCIYLKHVWYITLTHANIKKYERWKANIEVKRRLLKTTLNSRCLLILWISDYMFPWSTYASSTSSHKNCFHQFQFLNMLECFTATKMTYIYLQLCVNILKFYRFLLKFVTLILESIVLIW